MIKFIGDEVLRSGQKVDALPDHMYAIIGAPNPELAAELAMELKSRGLLDGMERKVISATSNLIKVNLTLDGWERYELEKRGQIAAKYGFIAMKFDDAVLDFLRSGSGQASSESRYWL